MKVLNKLNLKDFNSYQIQSVAECVYFPESINDFIKIFQNNPSEDFFIIGGGYNIILACKEYKNTKFMIISDNFSNYSIEGNKITTQSGLSLKKLSEIAIENSLSGVEIFYDIPGTVGGAVWMNAGAYGESFLDVVENVTVYNKDSNEVESFESSTIKRGYRYSQFQDRKYIILEATINLTSKNTDEIKEKMDNYYSIRTEKFPKDFPNAGSVFKRPDNARPVGEMLEKAGMKGFKLRTACISNKHAGFIINNYKPYADDILDLIDHIKEKVLEIYDVKLDLEQIIVKDK